MLLALGVALAAKYPTKFSAATVANPQVKAALAAVEAREKEMVEEWVRLTEIPAPSGQEQERAAYVKAELEALQLSDVRVDEVGNVSGVRKGVGGGPAVVFAAHMDTVFPRETKLTVRRDGTTLRAPGVGDDTSNLTAMLEMFRALDRAGVQTKGDLIFLATVQEETRLQGMKHWLTRREPKPAMLVAADIPLGLVWYGALRLSALRFVYSAAGAHTLMSRGEPNPAKAVAQAITEIYKIPLPEPPTAMAPMKVPVINVGKMGGGTVVNAIPKEAWFTVDLRSFDSATQDRLETAVVKAAQAAAQAEHVEFRLERPEGEDLDYSRAQTGAQRRAHPMVQTALDIQKHLKVMLVNEAMDVGSTDANVGVALGVPSIAVGAVWSRDAHTLEESADGRTIVPGTKMLLLLAVSLAELP
jgi:acetylornithine deacetylase/succinyl-diaminopimelate desuccinylase-like protein